MVCDLGMPFWLVQLVIFWVQCTQRQWPTPGKAAHKINNFHQVFNSSFLDETKNILPMVQPLWDFLHQITLHALTYHKKYISKPRKKKKHKVSQKNTKYQGDFTSLVILHQWFLLAWCLWLCSMSWGLKFFELYTWGWGEGKVGLKWV